MSWILRALPKGGWCCRCCCFSFSSALPRPYGPSAVAPGHPPPAPSSLPDRVFRVILLYCDSIVAPTAYTVSALRMLAFLPHARKHIRVRSTARRYPDNIHARTRIRTNVYAVRRARSVYADTEYLALSIQRKGITYYRRLPARRALIYCYPVRISCGKKRMPANLRLTLSATVSPASAPYPPLIGALHPEDYRPL